MSLAIALFGFETNEITIVYYCLQALKHITKQNKNDIIWIMYASDVIPFVINYLNSKEKMVYVLALSIIGKIASSLSFMITPVFGLEVVDKLN